MVNIIKQTFDKQNRLVKKENNGVITITEYNDNGQKTLTQSIYDGVIHNHKFIYDYENRLIKENIDDFKFIENKYEDTRFKNLVTEIKHINTKNNNNQIFNYEYNDLGLITKCFRNNKFFSEKTYDHLGNILLYEDINNNKVNYFYDDKFRLIEVIENNDDNYFESKKIKYLENNIIQKDVFGINQFKDEIHEIIIEEYDEFNNLIKLTNNGEIIEESKYSNDGKYLIYQKIDDNEYFYNEKGLEIKVITNNFSIESIYDLSGNLEEVIYSDGRTTKFEYDFNNNKTKEIYSNGTIIEYKNEYLITNLEICNYFEFDSLDLNLK